MGVIFQTKLSHVLILNEDISILNCISLRCILWYMIDKTSSFVQLMAWYLTGNKPLPELVFTKMSEEAPQPIPSPTLTCQF